MSSGLIALEPLYVGDGLLYQRILLRSRLTERPLGEIHPAVLYSKARHTAGRHQLAMVNQA